MLGWFGGEISDYTPLIAGFVLVWISFDAKNRSTDAPHADVDEDCLRDHLCDCVGIALLSLRLSEARSYEIKAELTRPDAAVAPV